MTLFIAMHEGQSIICHYLRAYSNFLCAALLSAFFLMIYLPFVSVFFAGYCLSENSSNFLFYYAVVGFFYIWLVITLVGVAIHLLLNLTEKSKKELFIAQYMANELQTIKMKDDVEKILIMSNMYETLNYKSTELLEYLKS